MAYTVANPPIDTVEGDLVRLWTSNLPVVGDAHAKYSWYYRDNPIGPGHAMMLNSTTDSEPVGCGGIGLRRLYVRGKPIETALLADLAVDKAHRTLMPALVLTKALRNYCRDRYELTYGFPNKHAEALFKRIGSHFLGRYTRYVLVLRSAGYLANHIADARIAQGAGWLADTSLRVRRRFKQPTGIIRQGLRLDWVNVSDHDPIANHSLDLRLNNLWGAASQRYPVIGYRGADFLRWRILNRPNGAAELAVLVDHDTESFRGYAAIEGDGNTAHIVDMLARSDDDEMSLLIAVARTMYHRGCTSLSLRFLGAPTFVRRLLSLGFRARESNRVMILDVADSLQSDREFLHDSSNWFILDGDEDS